MATHLKLKLVRSSIGSSTRQIENLKGLGLRGIGHQRILINTPAVRGMVKKVLHLVEVEEVDA
jgi:large subunit ribosomal protein L30